MCRVICTRTQYHSLQQSNGNFLQASDTQVIAAAASGLFAMPANCVLIGVYYNDDPATKDWKFVDTLGNADITPIAIPFPHSLAQSEVLNRDSGETNINTVLNVNKNLFSMFLNCQMIDQGARNVSVTNASGVPQSIRIAYIDYSWILAE